MIGNPQDNILPKLYLFNTVRITILSVILFSGLFISQFIDLKISLGPIFLFLILTLVLCVILFFLMKRVHRILAVVLQLVLDIVIISVLVFFSGGVISPFYFLYVLPIIISAFFFSRWRVIFVAMVCYTLFASLSNLIYYRILPFYVGEAGFDLSFGDFIFNLIISFFAFSSVAFLSSFYYDRLRKSRAEIENLQEDLRELNVLNNAVMDKIANGFMISNADGVLVSANNMARDVLDIQRDPTNVFRLLGIEEKKEEIKREISRQNKTYFERELGEYFLGVSVSVLRGVYSFDFLYAFVIIDLTERKKVEELLQQKEKFAMIGKMASGIAHELRNPLASISGSAQFLKKELGVKEKEYRDLLGIIVNESTRLSRVVDNFLQFSKSKQTQIEHFDISPVLQEVLQLIQMNHPRLKINRNFEPGFMVDADPNKIKQLIWNLVSNAVKAVNSTGTIDITLFERGGKQYLSIKDYGIGLSRQEEKMIFNPFFSKFSSGIGLGMFMVKQILNEHDFSIKIKSTPNVGTEVIVCMSVH